MSDAETKRIAAAIFAEWKRDHPMASDFQIALAGIGALKAARIALAAQKEAA